jgi:hypothetical protein
LLTFAVNKGQLDAGLALKPNSTSVTNEINARITNEFTARITSDATLASTDVNKTALLSGFDKGTLILSVLLNATSVELIELVCIAYLPVKV